MYFFIHVTYKGKNLCKLTEKRDIKDIGKTVLDQSCRALQSVVCKQIYDQKRFGRIGKRKPDNSVSWQGDMQSGIRNS